MAVRYVHLLETLAHFAVSFLSEIHQDHHCDTPGEHVFYTGLLIYLYSLHFPVSLHSYWVTVKHRSTHGRLDQ